MKKNLYKQINIWKKTSKIQIVCYRIFQKLGESKFFIQSADYFTLPITTDRINEANMQFVELLIESDIADRENSYLSIETAIENFEKDFS